MNKEQSCAWRDLGGRGASIRSEHTGVRTFALYERRVGANRALPSSVKFTATRVALVAFTVKAEPRLQEVKERKKRDCCVLCIHVSACGGEGNSTLTANCCTCNYTDTTNVLYYCRCPWQPLRGLEILEATRKATTMLTWLARLVA